MLDVADKPQNKHIVFVDSKKEGEFAEKYDKLENQKNL